MKSAGKVYKGGIVQIVSSPDSSSTIWKSCTTFGRRNYLLRLSQILHDDRHFLFQETVAILGGCAGGTLGIGRCDYRCPEGWRNRPSGRPRHLANRYKFEGSVTEEEYDASLIKKARINFRPGLALPGILTGLTYKKVAKKPVKTGSGETEEEEGGENLTA